MATFFPNLITVNSQIQELQQPPTRTKQPLHFRVKMLKNTDRESLKQPEGGEEYRNTDRNDT